jgi:hypothetical protein
MINGDKNMTEPVLDTSNYKNFKGEARWKY